MASNQIKDIEQNILKSKATVERGLALQRLKANKDFKLVVLEGYFKDEAVRLVHLKADPAMQTEDKQKSVLNQIDAIGAVSSYLQTVLFLAEQSAKNISADEQMIEELAAEELNNG